jgi:hypothetical protein
MAPEMVLGFPFCGPVRSREGPGSAD